jgi:hypothetical protein
MNSIREQLSARAKQPPSEPDLELGLPKIRSLLTPREAADYLRVEIDQIYRWVDLGELTAENMALVSTGKTKKGREKQRYLRIQRQSLIDLRKRRRVDQ